MEHGTTTHCGYWFVDLGQSHVWSPPHGFLTPCSQHELPAEIAAQDVHAFMTHDGQNCYWVDLSEQQHQLPRISLRDLIHQDATTFHLASLAMQRARFYKTHQFCGQCGLPLTFSEQQWMATCPCGREFYPPVNPCIIVAITREDSILLAVHQRHAHLNPPLYTLLAGFVEPNESLEQAVAREVREEAGIEVTDICYHGSQPWPFPHNMMVAFTARYLSGTIKIDTDELVSAAFYPYNQLPPFPPKGSVAYDLIVKTCQRLNTGS